MPDLYLLTKLIHILTMCLMVGATAINGILHGMARGASPSQASALLKAVMGINRLIMGPSLLVIPVSGYGLTVLAGYSMTDKWLLISATLSAALIVAYLVGLRLENRLHCIAIHSAAQSENDLPDGYNRIFWQAAPIGLAALAMSIVALYLMIFKPF